MRVNSFILVVLLTFISCTRSVEPESVYCFDDETLIVQRENDSTYAIKNDTQNRILGKYAFIPFHILKYDNDYYVLRWLEKVYYRDGKTIVTDLNTPVAAKQNHLTGAIQVADSNNKFLEIYKNFSESADHSIPADYFKFFFNQIVTISFREKWGKDIYVFPPLLNYSDKLPYEVGEIEVSIENGFRTFINFGFWESKTSFEFFLVHEEFLFVYDDTAILKEKYDLTNFLYFSLQPTLLLVDTLDQNLLINGKELPIDWNSNNQLVQVKKYQGSYFVLIYYNPTEQAKLINEDGVALDSCQTKYPGSLVIIYDSDMPFIARKDERGFIRVGDSTQQVLKQSCIARNSLCYRIEKTETAKKVVMNHAEFEFDGQLDEFSSKSNPASHYTPTIAVKKGSRTFILSENLVKMYEFEGTILDQDIDIHNKKLYLLIAGKKGQYLDTFAF
jgi:hypothetical protein